MSEARKEAAALAVFWPRGGRGAPAGGALDTDGRLLPAAATVLLLVVLARVSVVGSARGDVTPLSLPLKLVGFDPRRLVELLEGFLPFGLVAPPAWTEAVESILEQGTKWGKGKVEYTGEWIL